MTKVEIEATLKTIREEQRAALRVNDMNEYKILCGAEDAFIAKLDELN